MSLKHMSLLLLHFYNFITAYTFYLTKISVRKTFCGHMPHGTKMLLQNKRNSAIQIFRLIVIKGSQCTILR